MDKLKPCPFCRGEAVIRVLMGHEYICPNHSEPNEYEPCEECCAKEYCDYWESIKEEST